MLSLTNLNDLNPTSVCFLLNRQEVELIYLLTLNLTDSLPQPTQAYQVRYFFLEDGKSAGGVMEWVKESTCGLRTENSVDQLSFGADSNPNLLRRKVPEGGLVWSGSFVTESRAASCWQLVLAHFRFSPLGCGYQVPMKEGHWPLTVLFVEMLLKPACSSMLKPVWETTFPKLLSDKPLESCCYRIVKTSKLLRGSLNSWREKFRNPKWTHKSWLLGQADKQLLVQLLELLVR